MSNTLNNKILVHHYSRWLTGHLIS